jgi:hypothetical protein
VGMTRERFFGDHVLPKKLILCVILRMGNLDLSTRKYSIIASPKTCTEKICHAL